MTKEFAPYMIFRATELAATRFVARTLVTDDTVRGQEAGINAGAAAVVGS